MPIESASALAQLGIASVTPMLTGEWRVSGVSKVGVIRLGDIEVNIEPKVPLENLFYLLARGREWGAWFEHSIRVDTVDALYPAVAQAFATWAEQVLRAGPVRGYRSVRQAEPAIRGRWLVSEQIRVRHGLPLPAELQYDEFTVDIDENQLMRSAARRLVKFSGLPEALRTRLLRIDLQLQDVTLLTRGRPLPSVHFDRRNERYRPVLALAELILTNGSLDHRVGGTSATGFLLDLPRVFERFVEAEVTRAARAFGGAIVPQLGTWLDRDSHVRIRPDLVWQHDGRVRAVFDAKYKAEKPAGYPNADVYQMLAYCVRHELSTGHLIYAAGNEVPARYVIAQAGVEIYCHSIALDRTPEDIARQVDEIVASSLAASRSSRPHEPQ
jgi:5-methylcytosine-specific restriction enzyme subunit McrC